MERRPWCFECKLCRARFRTFSYTSPCDPLTPQHNTIDERTYQWRWVSALVVQGGSSDLKETGAFGDVRPDFLAAQAGGFGLSDVYRPDSPKTTATAPKGGRHAAYHYPSVLLCS
jgi:hypothetical protein